MKPLREFQSASEMRDFRRQLRARVKAWGPPPAPTMPEPELEPAPAPEPELPPPPPPSPPPWHSVRMTPIQRIIVAVSSEFNQPPHVIRSRANTQDAVVPRQVIALLAKELTGMSANAIGAVLGDRDHSTIMHSTSAIAGKMASDPLLALRVERLRHKLLEQTDEHATG